MAEGHNAVDTWTECLLRIQSEQDTGEFARLFEHFAPRIKGFLMKSGVQASQAEETMQEAMALVWHKAHQFDPARASAVTWIFTIVRNKQIDSIRRQRRPEPEDLPWGGEAPETPEEAAATSNEEARLREAVGNLPQGQKEIIEKAYFGDLSHSEIAAVTGLPLGTIKSRIRLGLERLRRELDNLSC